MALRAQQVCRMEKLPLPQQQMKHCRKAVKVPLPLVRLLITDRMQQLGRRAKFLQAFRPALMPQQEWLLRLPLTIRVAPVVAVSPVQLLAFRPVL